MTPLPVVANQVSQGIGCGVTTLVIPIMLQRLGWATFLVFACLNIGQYNFAMLLVKLRLRCQQFRFPSFGSATRKPREGESSPKAVPGLPDHGCSCFRTMSRP